MSLLSPRCPRCHEGKLFATILKPQEQCATCGLAFSRYNTGDGPAYFSVLVVGLVIMCGAGWVEYKFQPPFWLQAAIWLPAIFILSIFSLRMFRTLLIAIAFEHGEIHEGDR